MVHREESVVQQTSVSFSKFCLHVALFLASRSVQETEMPPKTVVTISMWPATWVKRLLFQVVTVGRPSQQDTELSTNVSRIPWVTISCHTVGLCTNNCALTTWWFQTVSIPSSPWITGPGPQLCFLFLWRLDSYCIICTVSFTSLCLLFIVLFPNSTTAPPNHNG